MDADRIVNRVRKVNPRNAINRLREYSSYTYGLSLQLMMPTEYNTILGTGRVNFTGNNVLVASAGRHNDTSFKRNPYFKEDFFFDELDMTTVIGMSQRTRSSNATEVNFKIIEPMGMTFLNRLLVAIDNSPEKGRNYLDLPYMLQIDFYGYDDDGNIASNLVDLTKYIPIKIVGIKMTVTGRGSEYSIKAVQFHDQAFTETLGAIPINMELKSGTVNAFVGELSKALNNVQEDLVKKKMRNIPDEYEFEVFDSEIGASSIKLSGVNPKRGPMGDPKTDRRVDSTSRTNVEGVAVADRNKIITSFNPGTSILVVLENMMRSTDFFRNQVNIAPGAPTNTDPIYWVRVLSKVTLKDFDTKINQYAKKITYQLVRYTLYNNKYPWGPTAKASEETNSVKKYEYIYTGNNTEILDFNLEFDAMFYVFTTADKAKGATLDSRSGKESSNLGDESTRKTSGVPSQNKVISNDQTGSASDGSKDPNAVAAGDMLKSMVTGSKGDMVQLKLKILGDPDFIKQDSIFYTDGSSGNSIATDSGEIYVTLKFRTPMDINQNTGLYTFGTASNPLESTIFSGLYRVITVKNYFRGGKFEQELQLVRLFDQSEFDFAS